MSSIFVEAKGPKGEQSKESLLPTSVAGYQRGRAVVYGADPYHATLAGAAVSAIGILEEDAIDERNPCAVIEKGQAVGQIGADITAGQPLATNAAGQLVPAASDQSYRRNRYGIAGLRSAR